MSKDSASPSFSVKKIAIVGLIVAIICLSVGVSIYLMSGRGFNPATATSEQLEAKLTELASTTKSLEESVATAQSAFTSAETAFSGEAEEKKKPELQKVLEVAKEALEKAKKAQAAHAELVLKYTNTKTYRSEAAAFKTQLEAKEITEELKKELTEKLAKKEAEIVAIWAVAEKKDVDPVKPVDPAKPEDVKPEDVKPAK